MNTENLEINKNNYLPVASQINIDGSIKYFKDEAARTDIVSLNTELNIHEYALDKVTDDLAKFKDKIESGTTYVYEDNVASVINTGDHIKIKDNLYDVFIATGLLDNWDSFNIPGYTIMGLLDSKIKVIESIIDEEDESKNVNIEFDIENSFAYNIDKSQVIPNTMVIDITTLSPKLYTIKFYGNPISD